MNSGATKKIATRLGQRHGGDGEEKGHVGDNNEHATSQMPAEKFRAEQMEAAFIAHQPEADKKRQYRAREHDLMERIIRAHPFDCAVLQGDHHHADEDRIYAAEIVRGRRRGDHLVLRSKSDTNARRICDGWRH